MYLWGGFISHVRWCQIQLKRYENECLPLSKKQVTTFTFVGKSIERISFMRFPEKSFDELLPMVLLISA